MRTRFSRHVADHALPPPGAHHARDAQPRGQVWQRWQRAAVQPRGELILIAWIGALAAMATLGGLAQVSHAPLVMAPFGASAVLLFGHPESPLTQPRNVLGGHCLGGVIGLATGTWLGDSWLLMALAVATTIALMKATRTVHPPAGATAIVCMAFAPDWWRLFAPVLSGSALLVVAAAIYNNAIEHRRYPRQWW